jgi:serine/threonine protein kinase
MTTTTTYTGTERYLSYELVLAGEDAIPTTASDVYAVGCIGLEVDPYYIFDLGASLIACPVYFWPNSLFQASKQCRWYDLC